MKEKDDNSQEYWQKLIKETNEKLHNQPGKTYVTLILRNNKIWLRGTLPVKPWLKEKHDKPYQQFLSLGRKATLTQQGLEYVLKQVKLINIQLDNDFFNWEYWGNPKENSSTREKLNENEDLTIINIWKKYYSFCQETLSNNTIFCKLASINRWILNNSNLTTPLEIKKELLKNKSLFKTKEYLLAIARAYDWAINQQIIEKSENVFRNLGNSIKIKQKFEIDIFTKEERDIIIKTFQTSTIYSKYAFLVEFLFYTGCRPSEAVALKWKNITDKFIIFDSVVNRDRTIKNKLKTQKIRRFPINQQLKNIIEKYRPVNFKPDDYLFAGRKKEPLNFSYFQTYSWMKIVKALVQDGLIESYKPPYQCRASFITWCLESGLDAKDVAALVGNSPEVIYKHYAGINKDLIPPTI